MGLVYKDMVYFPMTWSDSRFLGLQTGWSRTTGLIVTKASCQSSTYTPYDMYINDVNKTFKAKVADSKIVVNNKQIINDEEPYPLLHFRNITYFPLTTRFAVEEFGWKYSWSNEEGLKIESDHSVESALNNALTIFVKSDSVWTRLHIPVGCNKPRFKGRNYRKCAKRF